MMKSRNLWGGRFEQVADPSFTAFNNSYSVDRRLLQADVRGSMAHCNALAAAGIVTADEAKTIRDGLQDILNASEQRQTYFDEFDAEDIHSFVEARLVEIVGDAGRKLHTGRSRNDQVATDLRLWLRESIDQLEHGARDLQQALLELAEQNRAVAMPGYTHLQRAQPVLFAHWCLAYFEMLARDRERLTEVRARVNILPLGSAALAGSSFALDREALARELGFAGVSRNSLDAVSDRDFCVEFVGACSLIMVHLSRLAEEVVLYATTEFGFFELSDVVATGSSLMPQKKNPDSMELIRGKSGRVFGQNVGLLTMLKGLPLAYNKDMQEDKEAVFDAYDTTRSCLEVAVLVLRNVKVNGERMATAAEQGMMNATELADYLVRKGISFREAHDVVGRAVLAAIEQKKELEKLSLAELQSFSSLIEEDVFSSLTLEQTLAGKDVAGGTAPNRVAEALAAARASL